LTPVWGTNKLFAPVVPLGFQGGHGVVAGVKSSFNRFDYVAGYDVGMAAASLGIVAGVMMGTSCVNWAASKGLLVGFAGSLTGTEEMSEIGSVGRLPEAILLDGEPQANVVSESRRRSASAPEIFIERLTSTSALSTTSKFQVPRNVTFLENERPKAGDQVVAPESMDSLAYHLCLVSLTIGVAIGSKALLTLAVGNVINMFPLFPFCLISSLFMQVVVIPCIPLPVDPETMNRVLNTAQDLMIVSSFPLLNFQELVKQGPPFLINCVASMVWAVIAFFVLAPRVLPDYWAERALIELGVSTGSTATGLLLLRMADPDGKTPVLQQFGFKQVLHCLIVGGGVIDALSLDISNAGSEVLFVFTIGCLALVLVGLWAKTKCGSA